MEDEITFYMLYSVEPPAEGIKRAFLPLRDLLKQPLYTSELTVAKTGPGYVKGEMDEIKKTMNERKDYLLSSDVRKQPLEPLEWLHFIADEFFGLGETLEGYDSNRLEGMFWKYRAENPKTSKIVMYEDTAQKIGRDLYYLYEAYSYLSSNVDYNNEGILKAFEKNVVFPIIIDAIGIVDLLDGGAKCTELMFHQALYYSIFDSAEDVEKYFGKVAVDGFKKNPKLTEHNYEFAFKYVTEYFKEIKEGLFSHKLKESACKIKAYCILKVGSEKYAETEEKIKKQRSEKEAWSIPLGLTAWADIFHVGDNKMREWMRSKKKNKAYHFDKVSPRKWRLPINELPAEYLKNYSKYLENIGIQKAKSKRTPNSKP